MGGIAIELVDGYKLVRTREGSYGLPVVPAGFWTAYLIAVLIRCLLGFLAAWALYDADQLDSALTALGVGAGATGFMEHLSRSARSESREADTT